MLIAMGLLMVFFQHLSEEDLIKVGERQNEILAMAISNQIRYRLNAEYNGDAPENWVRPISPKVLPAIKDGLAREIKRLSILKIEVCDTTGLVIFSTSQNKIGKTQRDAEIFATVLGGKTVSHIFPPSGENSPDIFSSFLPLRTETGKVIGVLNIETDTTELLSDINEHIFHVFIALFITLSILYIVLHQIVRRADKTIKKQHSALQSNEKELQLALMAAQQSDNVKSHFLSSMSHELRTPLNSIMGFAQLLQLKSKDLPSDPKITIYAKQISDNGNCLLELIDQVLDLSEIENEKTDLSIGQVLPHEILHECLEIVQARIVESGLNLNDLTQEAELPILRTDGIRMQKILLILLSNAIKYNRPEGSITISSELSSNGFQRFSINDTGIGIPKNKQDHLFEPFNRLGLESSDIKGSGVGLSIAQQLVELLDGQIGFYSEEKIGSTFWIDLPISDDQSRTNAVSSIAEHTNGSPAMAEGQSKKLLYVEDNISNLELMAAVIDEIPNLTMLSSPDAESGIEIANHQQPDLIVMDINLPGMDGFTALERLKSNEKTRNIPVIALTAVAMPQDVEKGLKAGFEDYFTKPINIAKVLEAFNTHLR